MIELNIQIKGPKRGPGTWKLNTSLLNEEGYTQKVKSLITEEWDMSSGITDLGLRFDWLKYKIRQFSIKYSKQRTKMRRERESILLKRLEHLEEKICEQVACEGEIKQYSELKQQLEALEEEKAKGAWIRSRLDIIEKDEKSTSFFFNKSKQTFDKKTINLIEKDNGDKITDPKLILIELEQFYTELYRSTLSTTEERLINENDVVLKFTKEQKQSCEGDLTEEECLKALKGFNANKSPGCDGLPAEFYLTFWNQIGDKLVKTFNYCCKKGSLSVSQRRGVITLLEKREKIQPK